jgi:DNA repair protein RadC
MAIDLLNRFGDLQSIFRQPRESLCQIKGIGPKTAELLNIIDATQKRQSKKPHGIIVSGPNDVENFLIQELGAEPEERFMIILLDQKNKIIELMDMEHGIENRAHVYIKKIVRASLDRNATAVICVHNHPSGSLNFSPQDITLTKAIHHALQPIEIRLLDHFLVTQGDVVSMKTEGISF